MGEKSKSWFLSAAVAAAVLTLAGCNEPNGSPAPAADKRRAAAPASTPAAPQGSTTVVSEYTPGQRTVALTSCNLERMDGVAFGADPIEHPAGQTHSFSGWIAAPQLDEPRFQIRFDDKQAGHHLQLPVKPSIVRSDVTSIAKDESFSPNSGFKVDIPSDVLAAGRYHAYLVAVVGDTVHACDNGRQVVIN